MSQWRHTLDDPNIDKYSYQWVRNGSWRTREATRTVPEEISPTWGFQRMEGEKMRGDVRCKDLWAVMFGRRFEDYGCDNIQFLHFPTLLRCKDKNCSKDLQKKDINSRLPALGLPSFW